MPAHTSSWRWQTKARLFTVTQGTLLHSRLLRLHLRCGSAVEADNACCVQLSHLRSQVKAQSALAATRGFWILYARRHVRKTWFKDDFTLGRGPAWYCSWNERLRFYFTRHMFVQHRPFLLFSGVGYLNSIYSRNGDTFADKYSRVNCVYTWQQLRVFETRWLGPSSWNVRVSVSARFHFFINANKL